MSCSDTHIVQGYVYVFFVMCQNKNKEIKSVKLTIFKRPWSSPHLGFIADHQLVLHRCWQVVHSESKPRPLCHSDQSQTSSWLLRWALVGKDLQGSPVQRAGILLQDQQKIGKINERIMFSSISETNRKWTKAVPVSSDGWGDEASVSKSLFHRRAGSHSPDFWNTAHMKAKGWDPPKNTRSEKESL